MRMLPARLSSKISLGFALVLFFSIIDSIVNYKLSQEVNRNTEFLANSEAIIRNSGNLNKGIIEMQSGFRGYLLTGNANFLQYYHEGREQVPGLFLQQDSLIGQEPLQQRRLDSIRRLHDAWIEYANSLITAKREVTEPGKVSPKYKELFETKLQKEVGKKINDQIKALFSAFDRHEYAVRHQRREMLSASIQQTHSISVMIALITISIGIVSAISITRIITRRIVTMVNLADRISKGDFNISIQDTKNDELTHLSRSLNIMAERLNKNFTELEKKNRELNQFAYVVSHDLKAPLRGMHNISIWIEEDLSNELSEQLKKYLGLLKGRIQRLESLINGLLEYARVDRRQQKWEEVNMKELLGEITEMIVPPGFQVEIREPMPRFKAEKIRLEQVFSNLIDNAVKHHPQKEGRVVISSKSHEKYYQFSVSDDGAGIDPEYHEKIFGLFQTLREKDAAESTGVGLAIVKKIIEDQKGTIKVISAPGKGACFTFTWLKSPPIPEKTPLHG